MVCDDRPPRARYGPHNPLLSDMGVRPDLHSFSEIFVLLFKRRGAKLVTMDILR